MPLLVEEARSRACRRFYRIDAAVTVWAFTRIEIVSTIRRKQRANELNERQTVVAMHRLELLSKRWREVEATPTVSERAERLLSLHPLHAADSLQLAAALLDAHDRPRGRHFVTADATLAEAAQREGFALDSVI